MATEDVELQLLHKSDIFSPPIWYKGKVFETPSLGMSSDPRVGVAKMEQKYNIRNQKNGGELIATDEQLKQDFHIIHVKVKGNTVFKKDQGKLDHIEFLKKYRNELMISLVVSKANFSADKKEIDGVSSAAFKIASAICTEMFNEKF